MMEQISTSPCLNLLSGLILLFTSGYETWETLNEFHISAHHGVFVFSIMQLIRIFPEAMHGCKEVEETEHLRK